MTLYFPCHAYMKELSQVKQQYEAVSSQLRQIRSEAEASYQDEALTTQLTALQKQQTQEAAKASEAKQGLLQNFAESLEAYESWSRSELEELVSHSWESCFHPFKQETLAVYDKVTYISYFLASMI